MFLSKDLSQPRGPHDDFWYYPVGTAGGGVRVTTQTALAVPAMFACALVMGQTMGLLPCPLFRRKDRGREPATKHPLYRISRRPNRWQTRFQFKQMMQWHLMLRYNAYAEILFDRKGNVTELVPIHPDRVTVERFAGADSVPAFRYRVKPLNGVGADRVLVRGEMFHVRGLTSDGIEGFSPLDVQSANLGEALAAQSYSSRHLQNDARPGGVLEWDGHFKDDDERRKFRASWHEAQSGPNRGKTAVLEKGMTWRDLGVKNSDLQFIDLRKLKGYDVAAINRMPPHKIGLMERATFSNIEHQAIEFASDTVQPWATNWEQELSAQLLLDDEQEEYYFEHEMNALLRGDAKARSEYYKGRFSTASLSSNDIRALENEEPITGGDRYFVPVNMVPLDRVDDVVDKGGNKPNGPGDGGDQGGRGDNSRAAAMEQAAAERVVRKEVAALRKIPAGDGWLAAVEAFYAEHIAFVEDVMRVDAATAMAYCEDCVQFVQDSARLRVEEKALYTEMEHGGPRRLLEFARRSA
jgi:HK97 family phage portal protein